MIRRFKDIKGSNVTLVERSRVFSFYCTDVKQVNEFNLQMEGTAGNNLPATADGEHWQFEIGGSSWGTDVKVGASQGRFLVKAETMITAPEFWK